jgi:histidinol-phosphate aminotransferase
MHGRRRFMGRIAAGVGAAVAAPRLGRSANVPAPSELVLLNSNENPYGPSPRALDAITAARSSAGRYPDAAEEALLEGIARHHGVGRDEVALGCGSSEVLQAAAMAFVGAGRSVVAAEPTFEAVLAYARVTPARPVTVPLTADFRHDLPRMAAACQEAAGLVYVCNPNNPTGTMVTRDELLAFARAVPATTAILVDEAYHDFVEDARYASALELRARHPNVIVARTFSKIHGLAGLRLGYAVASREQARALRDHLSWNNVNGPALGAALASLSDTAHVAGQRRRLNGTRRRLCGELERDGRRYITSHTNFLMIQLGRDVQPVIDAFRARGLVVGRRFPSMPTWLRITIGTDEEIDRFVTGLRAIVPASKVAAAG